MISRFDNLENISYSLRFSKIICINGYIVFGLYHCNEYQCIDRIPIEHLTKHTIGFQFAWLEFIEFVFDSFYKIMYIQPGQRL